MANEIMRVFHLDAGRKYFSPASLCKIIDAAAQAELTHFQLYLTDNQGFRFALEDMTLTTDFGTYDLTPCLGDGYCEGPKRPSGCNRYLTEADMEAVLSYAREKGVGVIPVINMPGHMGALLMHHPHLRYPGSNSSIDLFREEGVAFALELLRRYADWFAAHGCTHMSFGADEFANDIAPGYPEEIIMGFDRIYNEGGMDAFVRFFNAAAQVICDRGMVPLAFHDGVYYRNDKHYGEMDRRVLLCYWTNGWDTYVTATADFLAREGFGLVNAAQRIYCGMGCRDWQERRDKAAAFDPYLFEKKTHVDAPAGAMLCFWSDVADLDGQVDGAAAAENVAPVILAFGKALKERKF